MTSPAPAAIHCDARGGIAQLGFDRAFDSLSASARGPSAIALFAQNGQLHHRRTRLLSAPPRGRRPRRLRRDKRAGVDDRRRRKTPVYCTNPIAFAAPLDEGPPLLIDQASSATAFVQLRHYAERGETLPPGWAVDADGQPTTDPQAALRGALLAFGGARGANIALMVEVMAAGLAGANWALDAPSFTLGRPLARRRPPRHRHRAERCSRPTFRSA